MPRPKKPHSPFKYFNADKQEVGRWANNRVENSHLPLRRRERAMLRFRQMKSLQKFASVLRTSFDRRSMG